MTRSTNGLVDIDEVRMWWQLCQKRWLTEKASCDQRVMWKERGMLDRKESRLSCGAMRFGCQEDAGKLASTEDLGEKGIFRDASTEELVGRCNSDSSISSRLHFLERREDMSSLPSA